eukprot:8052629-Lingulodinium_polyedra.AAC.1
MFACCAQRLRRVARVGACLRVDAAMAINDGLTCQLARALYLLWLLPGARELLLSCMKQDSGAGVGWQPL